MQEGSKDSLRSSPRGYQEYEYKANFKLFDVDFRGIVEVSEQPTFGVHGIYYGIERANLTPFNEAYRFDTGKKIYDESRIQDTITAYMQKTTKGWKLVNL